VSRKARLILRGLLVACVAGPCLGAAISHAPPGGDELARSTQKILNVRRTDGDVVTPLAGLMKKISFGSDPDEGGPLIPILVQRLNSGSDPDSLAQIILDDAHVGEKQDFSGNWAYGRSSDIAAVAAYLYAHAKQVAPHEPRQGVAYARAALLLAAQEDFVDGLLSFLRLSSDEDFAKIAQLTPQQAAEIAAIAEQQKDVLGKFLSLSHDLGQEIRSLGDRSGPLDTASVEQILSQIKTANLSVTNDLVEYRLACNVSDLLSLARMRHDSKAVSAIRDFLDQWKGQEMGTPVDRWITECLAGVDATSNEP
jgi:hypothetical protein